MIRLIPYTKVNNEWTISDNVMVSIYYKMIQDGILKTVFYEKEIDASGFVSSMQDSQNLPVIAVVDNHISGIFWINGIKSNYAFCHFFCFKETWGKTSKQIGQEVLNYWFSFQCEKGPLLGVLIGLIPEFNKKAVTFAEECGFNRVGTIPRMVNGNTSMVILYRLRN